MPSPNARKSPQPASSGKPVGAVTNALAILRYLGAQHSGATTTQIARALTLNQSTCFNILKTLVREQIVRFDEAAKTYRLGVGMIELAGKAMDQVGSLRQIHPELERLAATWHMAMTAWLRVSDRRVMLIDRADAASAVQIQMRIGHRLPLLVGALGRCMAAHARLEPNQLKQQYAEVRQENPLPFEQFLKQVEEAKCARFAVDRDGFVRGVTTVSSAVLDADGRPFLAISAITLTAQCSAEQAAAVGSDLRETASRLGATIGRLSRPSNAVGALREQAHV